MLELCANELEKQVDVKQVFIGLMERLADYATTASEVTETIKEKINLYELFKKNIDTLIEHSDASDFKNVLYLEAAFLKFTIRCYPTQAEYVNDILKSAVRSCSLHTSHMDEECQSFIVKILTLPLDSLSVAVLTMDEYPNLMKHLKFTRRREVAQQIAKIVAKNDLQLADDHLVGQLLVFIEPLLKKLPDSENISDVLFKDEQTNVARLVFQINNEDPAVVWGILRSFIEKFREGGPERIRFTYPSTIFKLLQLARQIRASNPEAEPKVFKKIFELSRTLINELSESQPRVSIKLYLQFLQIVNELDRGKAYDEFTYVPLGLMIGNYFGLPAAVRVAHY
jgi:vacuolar protein sorting-associated protein 35